MLFGATLDSLRSASILKNLRTLHVRVKQHSKNAFYLAQKFESMGIKTMYPGLKSNKFNTIFKKQMNPEYGFGGMLTIDVGSLEIANNLMELMQNKNLGLYICEKLKIGLFLDVCEILYKSDQLMKLEDLIHIHIKGLISEFGDTILSSNINIFSRIIFLSSLTPMILILGTNIGLFEMFLIVPLNFTFWS